jgi:hypothetical protein
MNAGSPNTLRTAGGEGFGAVDHDQQPAVGMRPPGDEIGEQGGDDGLVLAVAQPRPTGTLVPSASIASATTHQASAKGTSWSINAARSSSERSAHQLVQLRVGGGPEPAAHRRT